MDFRHKPTGRLSNAEPGTKLYRIFSRSTQWEPTSRVEGNYDGDPLSGLTVKELRALGDANGVDLPAKSNKAQLVDTLRAAGVKVAAVEDEPAAEGDEG